jgi:hypothetical protein
VVRRQKVQQILKEEINLQSEAKQQLESSNGIETCTDNFKAGNLDVQRWGQTGLHWGRCMSFAEVQDAYHATLREAAIQFLPVLVEVNLAMADFPTDLGFGVPSSPSLLLRLLGGDERPAIQSPERILKRRSEAAACDIVFQNNPSASTGAR